MAEAANSEPKNRLTIGDRARRMNLMKDAVELMTAARVTTALGIQPRSMRAKLDAARGIDDDDLRFLATGLERHAAATLAHAATIRATLAGRKDAA